MANMPVAVHKAVIKLMAGESMEQYMRRMSDSGSEYMKKKLGIQKEKGGAWLVEAYGDAAVFGAYKESEPTKYYSATYKRDKKGMFEFSSVMEVKRVVMYKPKEGAPVMKSAAGEQEGGEAVWAPAESKWNQIL